jgi:hypothetical protein
MDSVDLLPHPFPRFDIGCAEASSVLDHDVADVIVAVAELDPPVDSHNGLVRMVRARLAIENDLVAPLAAPRSAVRIGDVAKTHLQLPSSGIIV